MHAHTHTKLKTHFYILIYVISAQKTLEQMHDNEYVHVVDCNCLAGCFLGPIV